MVPGRFLALPARCSVRDAADRVLAVMGLPGTELRLVDRKTR
jgi:hypothetical protein